MFGQRSAAVAVTVCDERIGWTPDRLLAEIAERPTAKLARWMQQKADEAVMEIYKVDLFEDEVLSPQDLKEPTPELTARLDRLAKQWRLEHYRYMQSADYKRVSAEERRAGRDWEKEVRKLLFRSKLPTCSANCCRRGSRSAGSLGTSRVGKDCGG